VKKEERKGEGRSKKGGAFYGRTKREEWGKSQIKTEQGKKTLKKSHTG